MCVLLFLFGTSVHGQYLNWVRTYGSDAQEDAHAIAFSNAGGIGAVGSFQGVIDFDPENPGYEFEAFSSKDSYMVRLNTQGEVDWARHFAGTDNLASDAVFDAQDNMFVVGQCNGLIDFMPQGVSDSVVERGGYLCKLNSQGQTDWVSIFSTIGTLYFSGGVVDGDGNSYATGYFSYLTDFDPSSGTLEIEPSSNRDMFLLKLNASGGLEWVKTFGGDESIDPRSLAIDATHSFLSITGEFRGTVNFDPNGSGTSFTSSNEADGFVAKYNVNGELQWAKHLDGTSYVDAKSSAFDSAGNLVVAGEYANVVNIDAGGTDTMLDHVWGDEAFVVKYNATGSYLWSQTVTVQGNVYYSDVRVDASDRVYVCGSYSGSPDFDPGADEVILESFIHPNACAVSYAADGSFRWARQIGGDESADYARGIAVDASGEEVYLTGTYSGETDFDPGEDEVMHDVLGFRDVFVLKLGNSPSTIHTYAPVSEMSVYPNPVKCSGKFQLNLPDLRGWEIVDASGRKVQEGHQVQAAGWIEVALKAGSYVVKAVDVHGKTTSHKLIVTE